MPNIALLPSKPEWNDRIRQGLYQYNREQIGFRDLAELALAAVDEDGNVVGGIIGSTIWGWLLIDVLWVAAEYRHQGYGIQLLRQAEEAARQRGCTHVVLETFSFQALPFYQQLGFVVYGQLDGFPPGATRYSLKKSLQDGEPVQNLSPDLHVNLYQPEFPQSINSNSYVDELYHIVKDLLERRDRAELLQRIVDHAVRLLDAPYGEIMLAEGDELVVLAFTRNQSNLAGDRVKRGEALVSWRAYDSRQPVLIDDYFAWSGKRVLYDDAQLHAVADFPIMLGDMCLGVLAMARTAANQPFTGQDVSVGMQFAQFVAVVLNNLELYDTALREIAERRQAEKMSQAFLADMQALQELHLALSEIEDLTTLYKEMIRSAQQYLGLDRIGLFILNEAEGCIQGTFGVDQDGTLRDERYYTEEVTADHWTLAVVNNAKHVKVWEDATIYDNGLAVGTGWKVASALWDGHRAIGYLIADNFLTKKPIRPYEGELLSVLGSTFGHLIQRKHREVFSQAQNDALLLANSELAAARKQADAANKLKSQFLATMSHELRTPLNAIIGYTQLQLAGMVGELSEEQHSFQERILVNAQHLLNLINETLDISKIEAGRTELIEAPFGVRQFLQEVETQNRILAENKHLAFTIDAEANMPDTLVGDRGRIKQILINLIANAIKFTDHGSVTVDVKRYSGTMWRISVKDTGIGIPAHKQQTIFDEFQQTEEGIQRGGTGLGLAIAKKLVLMMNGTIRLESEAGKGSTFIVTLPLTLPSTDLVVGSVPIHTIGE